MSYPGVTFPEFTGTPGSAHFPVPAGMDGVVWDQHDEWLRAERDADECEVDVDEVVCEFLDSDRPWSAELHTRLLRACDRLVDFPRDTVIADFVDDVLGHIAFLLSSHGKYTGLRPRRYATSWRIRHSGALCCAVHVPVGTACGGSLTR